MNLSIRAFEKKLCTWQCMLLVMAVFGLASCVNKAERESHYMTLAKSYMEKNQQDLAIEQFNNVLQINSTNYEAQYFLGLIYESRQQYSNAIEKFTRAIEQNPHFVPAQTHLANMHLLAGQNATSLNKATTILKTTPVDLASKTLMAEVDARTGNLEKGIVELERAKKNGGETEDFYAELASLYLRQGSLAKAEMLLLEGTKKYPKSVALLSHLIEVYLQTNSSTKAEIPLQALVALNPGDFSVEAKLAAYYVGIDQSGKAESVLRSSVEKNPGDMKRILALKELLLRFHSPEAAELALQGQIQASPKILDLRFALADLYEETSSLDKAERVYIDIIALNTGEAANEKSHTRLASMYLNAGKLSTAKTHVAEALKLSRNSTEAFVIRGKIALQEGDLELAVADFRSALKHQPDSAEYVLLLARATMLKKQPGLAKELLFQAAKNHKENQPIKILLGEVLVQMRDYKGAQEVANGLIKSFPFDPAPFRLRDGVSAAQKGINGSEVDLTNPETTLPYAMLPAYRQGGHYLEQRKYEEAVGEFQKILRVEPSAIEPLIGIVQAYLGQGRPDMALKKIKAQLHINSPTLHQAYFLLGEMHAGQNHYDEAVRAYQRALDIRSSWDAPYLALARIHFEHGKSKQAQSILESAARVLPRNQLIPLQLASMYEANQNFDRAIAVYENLIKANPDLDVATNNLAVLLIDRRGDKASVEHGLNLVRRFQTANSPAYLDTLGWALLKNGQASRALFFLEKALSLSPDVPVYHYHAGVAYKAAGSSDKAKTHLFKALSSGIAFSGRDQAKAMQGTL
jgi:tetratricopeptide (TPR) repeat protein